MKTTFKQNFLEQIYFNLQKCNQMHSKVYPGDSPARQPVHTVYGGAHLFKSDTAKKMGTVALNSIKINAPDPAVFAKVLNIPAEMEQKIYHLVINKLKNEAIEDFRIDFEDGYGNRPDAEEDSTAEFTALELAKGMTEETLPPFIGIRIKPFSEELKKRSIRTLDIFISTLIEKTGCKLPANFVVTLPKVNLPEQVSALVELFEMLEAKTTLQKNSLKMEIMIETTQSILNPSGQSNLLALIKAAKGRCTGAHFGTYDYTASCDITAKYQTMDNEVCDFAKQIMKVSLAGTGVWLSDGATNVMPVGPFKGDDLSESHRKQNTEIVHAAWITGYNNIIHSLRNGFYQGWDLHPAQLPVRYAAVYTFFLSGYEQASTRLRNFMEKAAQATLTGDVFDDAATGQGLLNFFLRAMNCGALTEKEILATGLNYEEIRGKSFLKILDKRKHNIINNSL